MMISHLALIMDGNRRWAKKNKMFPWLGHRQGAKTVEMVIQYCLEQNISTVSLYTFSLENFKRTEKEVSYLFSLIKDAKNRIQEFVNKQVQVRFVGDREKIPEDTLRACEEIEDKTKGGTRLLCNFLFCYGGRQEIVAAVQKLIVLAPDILTPEIFKKYLWLGDIPDPEIIVRTGGVKRLSNFLLFQTSYSEIRFLDCLWPDLDKKLLHTTILDCLQAQKNIGK